MKTQSPQHSTYDVIIIGGAMMGASAAWFLSDDKDFNGRVLVVDRDLSYENTSTMHTNSCMRQLPELSIRSFGYMYLADNDAFADVLRESRDVQVTAGAATQLMTPDQMRSLTGGANPPASGAWNTSKTRSSPSPKTPPAPVWKA